MIRLIKNYKMLFTVSVVTVLLISCANMGQGPQGGPRDWNAPKLVSASPKHNSTNVKGNKLELVFNENIVVKDQNQKVIVTPPQRRMPIIRHGNKKITVELRDTLLENTTYTIDFTDAIEDNNENNPVENFSISFSTGDVVDSLTVSGKVIQARDNEPVKGYYVGLHSNLEDTAFTHTPFLRISRTNDKGEFTIRGIAAGRYHVFALDDKNRDYIYDNPMEALAFYDAVLEPSTEGAVRTDTIFADEEKTLVDSIKTIQYTRFLPDNLVLKSFLSDKRREYFRNAERQGERKIVLNFGVATAKPILEPLNFDPSIDWMVEERNISKDSVYTYWIKDESIMKMDSLLFNMTYNKTDSLNQLISVTDSLLVVNRERKDRKKKKNDKEEDIVLLDLTSNIKQSWDVYNNIEIEFDEPFIDSLRSLISLQQKIDTTYHDAEFNVEPDSLNPRKFKLQRRWKYGEEYKIAIDSATIYSIYGTWNDKLEQPFKVKNEDQYGHVAVSVNGIYDTIPSFIELLDSSGKPIRKSRVIDGAALFKNINPGKYFARIIMDTNGNYKWDTGNYELKRQPEAVYYYPSHFEVRAHWEDIIVFDVDLESVAKPEEILKNKPVDNKKRGEMLDAEEERMREEERQRVRQQEDMNNPAAAARRRR